MSSLEESVLVALAQAVPIDDADLLLRQLAQGWRSVTQAAAVSIGVEHGNDRTLRSVLIDRTGLVTHADLRLVEGSDIASKVLRLALPSATDSAEPSSGSELPVHSWELSAHNLPVGLMVLVGGTELPHRLNDLFLTATAELLARTTERERQLRDAKLEALGEFAAGAGHEINNPLAAISGRAQLLLREEQDPQRRRHLTTIGAQALRIRDMIGDTMLFARPPVPEPQLDNLSDVIQGVIGKFAQDLEQHRLTVERNLSADVPVWADETQLRIVISELIRNAIEASPAGATIHIDASCKAAAGTEWARLRVRDAGSGLSDEAAGHLFDPFYSGRQAGRGLGFGLSKCWRIVTNHGGLIEVEDRPLGGFGIVIDWPAGEPLPGSAPT